jgi:leader peptidase (prepilin peptidase)/N-methyltransferase
MSTLFFFLFGLIIGSFLNAVIYRLQTEESLMGRSHCRSCVKPIAWYDNIPVLSFAILRAKCRQCGERIAWQYPMIEVVTGMVFAFVGRFVFDSVDMSSWMTTAWYLGLTACLIVIFVHDMSTLYIPMTPLLLAIVWTAGYLVLGEFDWSDIWMHLLAAFGAFAFFWLLVEVSKETWMGMGDAYLAFLVGLVTGWPGVLWTMTFSFGLGAVVGIALIVSGTKSMKSQVPFAPFLTTGVFVALFLPVLFPQLHAMLMSVWSVS